jgi:protein phosphatase
MHSLIGGVMVTHRGLRRVHNEDAIGYDYPAALEALDRHGALFMLADGVGGMKQGELYSAQTIERLPRLYRQAEGDDAEARLVAALQALNGQLYQQQLGGATTFVGAVFIQQRLIIAQVGDSRAYVLDGAGRFIRLTEDHLISLPNGRHKLTRALGHKASLSPDTISGPLPANSRLLLCSDGLTRYLDDETLARLCDAEDLDRAAEKAVRLACKRGGIDNISLMILEVGPPIRHQETLTQHLKTWRPLLELPDDLGIIPDLPKAAAQAAPPEPILEADLPTATQEMQMVSPPTRRTLPQMETGAASAAPRQRQSSESWLLDDDLPPSTPAALQPQRSSSGRTLIALLLLLLAVGAGAFLALGGDLSSLGVPTQAAEPTLTETVPVQDSAPTPQPQAVFEQASPTPEAVPVQEASPTPQPQAVFEQASPTPARERFNGPLELDDRLRFAATALTFLRLDSPSSAFNLQTDRIYRLDNIAQASSDGRTWLRLQDSETERYGWIPLDAVPDYEILLP